MNNQSDAKPLILEHAYELFSERGFDGASMKMIASRANISTSLIFHHFQSKEHLWVSVERYVISQKQKDLPHVREDSLENFLQDIIRYRLNFYSDAQFRRFFQWRSLRQNTHELALLAKAENVVSEQNSLNIPDYILRLQTRGLIRENIDHYVAAMMIFVNSTYAVFDYINYYAIHADRLQDFIEITVHALHSNLQPTGAS